MKQKMTLLFVLFLYGYGTMAQMPNSKNRNEFYRQLILGIGVGKDIPIFYKTSTVPLKRVKLADNKLKWFGNEEVPGMLTFLTQVDVEKLTDSEPMPQIEGHPFITKKYEGLNSRPQPFLEFSPIFYSNDGNLALCSVYHWSSPEAASETIYILRCQASGWKIVKFLVVSIS